MKHDCKHLSLRIESVDRVKNIVDMSVGHEVQRNIVTVHKPISITIRSSTSRSPRDR